MNHGSLFSGIGGPELAAEWMGWNNVFHCEINPFGKQVLNYYWPKSICYDDVKTTNFLIHRGTIDILTGGFPCQPYSAAGKRKGKDDERHLWPFMLEAIRQIQPRWVVGENVSGLINWNGGMVFDEVQADLEAEGYEVQAYVLPAVSINAPHRRDRTWFVAYAGDNRCNDRSDNRQERCISTNQRATEESKPEREGRECGACTTNEATTDTSCTRQPSGKECNREVKQERIYKRIDGLGEIGITSNTRNQGLQRLELNGTFEQDEAGEQTHRPVAQFYKIEDWRNFPTQSPVCSGDDGLSGKLVGITVPKHRTESIKAYGNAIVPQVIHQIFKSIAEYENLYNENPYNQK
jgi:DNA (cytosine-5)-methyltransferase 1